jgi:hypothetical protein
MGWDAYEHFVREGELQGASASYVYKQNGVLTGQPGDLEDWGELLS